MTNQSTVTRQVIEADAMSDNGHKPASSLAARVNEAATILKSTLSQSETDQLNLDLSGRSLEKQRQILTAWFDYKEDTNIFTAAKLRITTLKAWDGNAIWINERKNGQNVFLWADYFNNIILQWQQVDKDDLVRKEEIVRVGYLIPGAIVDPWCFSLTPEEYNNWVARCNGRAPSLPKRKLEGGFLASESSHNYGKRRYQ